MSDKDEKVPTPEELKATEDAKIKADADASEAAKGNEDIKVGEIGKEKVEKPAEAKAETVEELKAQISGLVGYKSEVKKLEKQVEDLQEMVKAGGTKTEVSAAVKALQEQYPDSKEFIGKLYGAIKTEMQSETEKVTASTKKLEKEEKQKQMDAAFKTQYDKTIAKYPEYKDIAKEDIIKSLSLDPKNADKTFPKLLEETYGHLLQGKKTIEKKVQARADGTNDAEIDIEKARKDTDYFKEIMKDPEKKKKYNENLGKRLHL